MANSNVPLGLRPINDNGTMWTGQGRLYYVPASVLTSIFVGDPLVPLGGTDAFGVPAVGIATAGAGNAVLGAMVGVQNGPAGSGITITRDVPVYHVGATAGYILGVDDEDQLYSIQEDSVGGAIAQGVGGFANGNLVAGAGSTITGGSGWQLQSSSVSAAANPTYQMRILGLTRGPDNALGNFADWVVRINNHALSGTSGF